MTTTQTDALMALADRYAFHIPGSQHSDEARAALLAALQAREGEAVAKVVLTKTLGLPTMQWLGLDKQFDLADGQLLYTTPPQPAAQESTSTVPVVEETESRDAAFEAVRKLLTKVPRYSFHIHHGLLRRAEDQAGNWIEFEAAHKLFDPVVVDAAIAAGQQYLKENGK